MKIIVEGKDSIVAIGYNDPERALEAHGYDPDQVEWSVERSPKERIEDLEARLERLE